MITNHFRSLVIPALTVMCLAPGCGGSVKTPNEKLVAAAGVIKLDGKPADGVRVRFTPYNDSTKTVGGAWAVTDSDGAFDVIHWTNKKGIVPGSYLLTFSKMMQNPTELRWNKMNRRRWSMRKKSLRAEVEYALNGQADCDHSAGRHSRSGER